MTPTGGIKADSLRVLTANATVVGIVNQGADEGWSRARAAGGPGDEGMLADGCASPDAVAAERDEDGGEEIDGYDLGGHSLSSTHSSLEDQQRQRLIKRRIILQVLGSQAKTEREILAAGVGDTRYAREVLRRLCAEGKIFRSGAGGSADPFRYTAARYYQGAQQRPLSVPVEVRLQRIAKRIQEVLMDAEDGRYMTERDIRAAVGDNIGTGKALRLLHRTGCVARMGKGGGTQPFQYSFLRAGDF